MEIFLWVICIGDGDFLIDSALKKKKKKLNIHARQVTKNYNKRVGHTNGRCVSLQCVRGAGGVAVPGVGVSGEGVSRMCHHGCHVDTCRACKPFTCPHCPYATRNRADLVKHMRTHTGERPFPCPLCNYRASDRSTLRKHFLRHKWNRQASSWPQTAHPSYHGLAVTQLVDRAAEAICTSCSFLLFLLFVILCSGSSVTFLFFFSPPWLPLPYVISIFPSEFSPRVSPFFLPLSLFLLISWNYISVLLFLPSLPIILLAYLCLFLDLLPPSIPFPSYLSCLPCLPLVFFRRHELSLLFY